MAITLRIDNFDQLPDGGPVEFRAGPRGFDIGREQHLDWCLPDPDRVVSGHHCQVRYEGGGYVLYDVSRNGTYVNGSPGRVKSPYQLQHGDRLQIGPYIITVAIGAGNEAPPPFAAEQLRPAAGGRSLLIPAAGTIPGAAAAAADGGARPSTAGSSSTSSGASAACARPMRSTTSFRSRSRAPEPFQPPPSLRNVPPSQIPDRAPPIRRQPALPRRPRRCPVRLAMARRRAAACRSRPSSRSSRSRPASRRRP